MSSLPKCRRVKRPTLLAKRSQPVKKVLYKKQSYKPLYEKLKGNNNALAKALSKEKQESQYLFTENLALTSRVQELGVACNQREDIISVALKNAKDMLALLVTLTSNVTNTIASCQQIAMSKTAVRKSTGTADRRESNRRMSTKSPARGVVQPMVSGHTITKPTINLSRLNIQRAYRAHDPPNLSDIEEAISPPELSPPNSQAVSPVHNPLVRPLNCGPRRIERMPERIQRSLRTSDESERRSSIKANRNSARNSLRRSRRDSENPPAEVLNDERLRSPRVSLHDVSRLLQNAQTVNIRTLLEASSDMETTQIQHSQEQPSESVTTENTGSLPMEESSSSSTSENEETLRSPPPSRAAIVEAKSTKDTSQVYRASDDPLEGPSWLLNDSEVASLSEERVTTTVRDLPVVNDKETKRMTQSSLNDGNSANTSGHKDQVVQGVNRTARPEDNNDDDDDDDNDDFDETTLDRPWLDRDANYYRSLKYCDDRTDTNLPSFVTRKRGSHCDDTDDFTLMWRKPAKNYNFDINDLEMPVIDSPIARAPEVRAPEPEITTNVPIITTQNFANLTSVCPRIDYQNDTFANSLQLTASPSLLENPNPMDTSLVEQNERSDEESESTIGKRKRRYKKPLSPVETFAESDWTPTPKRKNLKEKRKQRTKDPSSAKVVLRKLNDDRIVKSFASPETRQSRENDVAQQRSGSEVHPDPSSDSEISNASSNKVTVNTEIQGRPRRQKAPKNLQEPSLGKKLRRN